MITSSAWRGKRYAVLGLARSGQAALDALLTSGADVKAWDSNPTLRASFCEHFLEEGDPENSLVMFGDTGASVELADPLEINLSGFAGVVVSPGVPINRHPIADKARAAGVPLIGDIELFAQARAELPPHKVVGITGTNGKSTTTALVHHILKTAGVPSLMGGNIGLPILSQDPLPEGGVYVLELSSYQIDLTRSLDCDVAVLLNITPDHLDRYESFEAYAASKARLFEMQHFDHPAVVVTEDDQTSLISSSLSRPDRRHYALKSYDITDRGLELSPALRGPHNLQNAVAAQAVCLALHLSDSYIEVGLGSYPGLPHRMERIREKDGVLFVNDSKATNAEAAAPALAAYPRVRWILGGQAKAETLGDTARHLDHVVKAYTIGEAGPMFARLLRQQGVEVEECETLENAVNRAAADSQSGETVLLSPASASFDQFRDFEARGDRFRELVEGL